MVVQVIGSFGFGGLKPLFPFEDAALMHSQGVPIKRVRGGCDQRVRSPWGADLRLSALTPVAPSHVRFCDVLFCLFVPVLIVTRGTRSRPPASTQTATQTVREWVVLVFPRRLQPIPILLPSYVPLRPQALSLSATADPDPIQPNPILSRPEALGCRRLLRGPSPWSRRAGPEVAACGPCWRSLRRVWEWRPRTGGATWSPLHQDVIGVGRAAGSRSWRKG